MKKHKENGYKPHKYVRSVLKAESTENLNIKSGYFYCNTYLFMIFLSHIKSKKPCKIGAFKQIHVEGKSEEKQPGLAYKSLL